MADFQNQDGSQGQNAGNSSHSGGFQPMPQVPSVPMPQAGAPVPPQPPQPQGVVTPSGAIPTPQNFGTPVQSTPSASSAPKKPMTLEELAKQNPIFSDDELDEDDFDPWAPIDSTPVTPTSPSLPEIEKNNDIKQAKEDSQKDKKNVEQKNSSNIDAPKKEEKIKEEESEQDTQEEIIEGTIVSDPQDIDDPFEDIEPDEDKSVIAEFFENANLSAGKIIGCVGGVLILIAVIMGLFLGGRALYNSLNTGDAPIDVDVPDVEVPDVDDVDDTPTDVPDATDPENLPAGWVDPSLYIGIRTGTETANAVSPDVPGKDSPIQSGGNENIIEYIEILARIRALYELDVFVLLDSSTNRTATFNDLTSQMQSVLDRAESALPEIAERKAEIESLFDQITLNKQAEEDAFFVNLNENESVSASENLDTFIVLARDSVDLRARFRALDRIEELMSQYIVALSRRLADVQYNKEALIKGVRVVDVENSDIDLIIPESDL